MATVQLLQEIKHVETFKTYISSIGCVIIKCWGSGSENKKNNCDADFTIKILDNAIFSKILPNNWNNGDEKTVSLKTPGGNFTLANGGTSIGSDLYKRMDLNDEEIQAIIDCNKEIKSIKNQLGKSNRWIDVDISKKYAIKELLIQLNYNLFQYRNHQKTLYTWLSERMSDLKYVGNNLYIPNKKNIPLEVKVEELGNDSLIVGCFKLRFKASGGWVKNSWKINYEFIGY